MHRITGHIRAKHPSISLEGSICLRLSLIVPPFHASFPPFVAKRIIPSSRGRGYAAEPAGGGHPLVYVNHVLKTSQVRTKHAQGIQCCFRGSFQANGPCKVGLIPISHVSTLIQNARFQFALLCHLSPIIPVGKALARFPLVSCAEKRFVFVRVLATVCTNFEHGNTSLSAQTC